MTSTEYQRVLPHVPKNAHRGIAGVGEAEDVVVSKVRYVSYGVVAPILVTVGLLGNLLTMLILTLPQFRGINFTCIILISILVILLSWFVDFLVKF